MKKALLTVLAGIGLLLVSGAAATYWQFRDALIVDSSSFADRRALLEPYAEVYLPEGSGRVPAILMFHGCGGLGKTPGARTREAMSRGYAVVLVDSHTPRGLDSRRVCAGKVLHGAERAGDVLVALEIAREHPRIDGEQLILAGFSHGGWTVLEALAVAEGLPPGLDDGPADKLLGVQAVVAWYPYCGFPSRFVDGWDVDIPVFMPLAELDETTDPAPCEAVSRLQSERGKSVKHIVYPGVSHAFDEASDWVKHYDPSIHAQAVEEQYAFLASALGR